MGQPCCTHRHLDAPEALNANGNMQISSSDTTLHFVSLAPIHTERKGSFSTPPTTLSLKKQSFLPKFVGAKGTQISAFLNYLNDIRQHPAKYADRIQALYVAQCEDYNGYPLNTSTNLLHNEDWTLFTSAISHLQVQAPVGSLRLDEGLCACAQSMADLCARMGESRVDGVPGIEQRILQFGRYTKYNGGCGENCGQHIDHDPEKWVLDYVIDEGNPNRGHRENIFNANYTKVGLGTSQSADGKWFTTMDFAYDCYCSNAISGEMKYSIGLG